MYLFQLFMYIANWQIHPLDNAIKYLNPKYQVPYFIDPNTGFETGNYKQILSHIFQTYSAATP